MPNVDADPALKRGRPSRSGRTRRGSALTSITIGTDRATGVGSTACPEGSLRQWGRPGVVAGVASCERGRKGSRTIWVSERVRGTAEAG
jgi:hypothetical protein